MNTAFEILQMTEIFNISTELLLCCKLYLVVTLGTLGGVDQMQAQTLSIQYLQI